MKNKSKEHVYIIGEIGQNHNGSVDIAKLIIDLACRPIEEDYFGLKLFPMDAVKLTKRDLTQELSKSQMDAPYNSPHAFAETYGAHRAYLELNDDAHFEIYKYTKSKGVDFIETLCAIGCLSLLKLFTPDYLKVASRDLEEALGVITKYHSDISILHCVSQYPTHPDNVNLRTIDFLKENYKDYTIGYSDHTIGIATSLAAVAMGAKIIEKHITIDRRMKGTDQAGSLGPDGVNRMVRDIRLYERSLGKKEIFIEESVTSSKKKLERSIATIRKMKKGEVITINDIHLLSPGDGLKWSERDQLIGKTIVEDIEKDEILYPKFFN